MKVITFPLMGAEPHSISLTLPPTWTQLIASVQIPSIAACIKTDLLPDKPEEQLIPHRVAPHNALVQLICLELEAQVKYLDTPTKCLKIE